MVLYHTDWRETHSKIRGDMLLEYQALNHLRINLDPVPLVLLDEY